MRAKRTRNITVTTHKRIRWSSSSWATALVAVALLCVLVVYLTLFFHVNQRPRSVFPASLRSDHGRGGDVTTHHFFRLIEQIIQYVQASIGKTPPPTFATRYINLEQRRDRRDHIETILADFEYARHNATYLPAYGALGAAYSHKNVLEQYMATCVPCVPLLIVEDDIKWSVQKAREEIQRTIQNLQHWDVLMLSANPGGTFLPTDTAHVLRVQSAQTASAYLVNTHYQQTLLGNLKESVQLLEQRGHPKQDERVVTPEGIVWNTDTLSLDQHWKRLQKKAMWFFRPMATHIMTYSNIYNVTTDYGDSKA